jgi:hypothetical protein
MIQTIIVVVIVALAAVYIIHRYYLKFQQARQTDNRCRCDCSGCDDSTRDSCIEYDSAPCDPPPLNR